MDSYISIRLDRLSIKKFINMSRSKKVDTKTAIESAMALFWKQGYNNLGTRQIEEETGITRFTLQTSYGGKKPLFLMSLDAYLDTFELYAAPNMADGNLDTIADWFNDRAKPKMFAEVTCYGCLLLNSTVEFAAQDADVNLRADRFFKIVRSGFHAALSAVKQKGGVSSDFEVAEMAEVLLSAAIGLNIMIRSAGVNAAGKDMAQSIGKMIMNWQNDK